jgi:hypothetical protein
MKLNTRQTCSIAILALLYFMGCGDEPALPAPAAPGADAGEPSFGGSAATSGRRDAGTNGGTAGTTRRDAGAEGGAAGTARRDAGGDGGTSSALGSGGASGGRDAGRGGSGTKAPDAGGGASSSGGRAGGGDRDAGRDTGDARVDGGDRDAATASQVVINEIVADPQRDWNDSSGGGTPFDATPGNGSVTGADEWVELYNGSDVVVDLTGWTLVMTDTTPASEPIGSGEAMLSFSASGVLSAFQPGEFLVVGNPKGDLNNTVTLELYDALGVLVDRVALGGDGGGPSGNATGSDDEAIARVPNATDSDDDAADLSARPPTPGAAN